MLLIPTKEQTDPVQCHFVTYVKLGLHFPVPAYIFMNKPNLTEHGIIRTSSYPMKRPLGNASSFTSPLKRQERGPQTMAQWLPACLPGCAVPCTLKGLSL